jgi:hypothetical protein
MATEKPAKKLIFYSVVIRKDIIKSWKRENRDGEEKFVLNVDYRPHLV